MTAPVQRPVRYNGLTQLSASSIFSILSLRNMILAIIYRILLSVNTFSSITTVLPVQEQLIQEKKILYRSSSSKFQHFSCSAEEYLRQLPVLTVLRGTRSPTSPIRMNSLPNQIMISSFLEFYLSILLYYELMQNKHHCSHYERNCRIEAPCCGVYFSCKICHDEQFQFKKGCQVDRMLFEQVKHVKCLSCQKIQQPAINCIECGIEFGKYCCLLCRLYENNPQKVEDIFHCDECKMCRRGSKETVTHCSTCGYCVPNESENHKCIANKAQSNCPVCLQVLIYSIRGYISLKCGHLIHAQCWEEMNEVNCPTCGMANFKMPKKMVKRIQKQIKTTKIRLPSELKSKKVNILCNQCLHKTMQAPFHFFGIKCSACGTYNTKLI